MGPNPADPIAVAAKLLAMLIGLELASFLAPHIVILLAGTTGAVFGVMGWRQCTRAEAAGYVAAMTMVAWLFTGSAATLAARQLGIESPGPLLAPVAAAIGWTGHRWPLVARWALNLARRAIETRTSA